MVCRRCFGRRSSWQPDGVAPWPTRICPIAWPRWGACRCWPRTLGLLARCGIRRVGVTVGWQGVLLRRRLEELRVAAGRASGNNDAWPAEVQCFENPDWDRPNGLSVLAARRFITEPTLLLMADQIAAPALIQSFATLAPPGGRTVLGIDRDLSRVFDIDDATKVALASEPRGRLRVAAHGQGADRLRGGQHQPVRDGALAARGAGSPARAVADPGGGGGRAPAGWSTRVDVTGAIWQDVDSAEMRLHADWLLRAYGEELARPDGAGPGAVPGHRRRWP